MNEGQFKQLMKALGEIRDGVSPKPEPIRTASGATLVNVGLETTIKSLTLHTLLKVLDGWIEGEHSNHEAGEHRDEGRGDECWKQFSPSDIRNMVNDVARELGVPIIPLPARPVENSFI